MNITQSMERSLVDGFTMCMICMASVIKGNSTYHVDMRWSGVGLQQSLWVNQLQVMRHRNCIVRKLCFSPWLDSHAGEYTCHVVMKDDVNFIIILNKTCTVNGMLHIVVVLFEELHIITIQYFDGATHT